MAYRVVDVRVTKVRVLTGALACTREERVDARRLNRALLEKAIVKDQESQLTSKFCSNKLSNSTLSANLGEYVQMWLFVRRVSIVCPGFVVQITIVILCLALNTEK